MPALCRSQGGGFLDGNSRLPRTGTVSYHLLELTAICGELPADLLPRIPGSTSYKESVITSLKKDGLLRTYYRDKLRGYRLGRMAKTFLMEENPERFSFFLTGNGETSRLKSEFPRRLRLHRVAEIFVSMQNAGIRIFRDEKPDIFSSTGSPIILCVFILTGAQSKTSEKIYVFISA